MLFFLCSSNQKVINTYRGCVCVGGGCVCVCIVCEAYVGQHNYSLITP